MTGETLIHMDVATIRLFYEIIFTTWTLHRFILLLFPAMHTEILCSCFWFLEEA
jgi:hypothetical protein